jgi:protease I
MSGRRPTALLLIAEGFHEIETFVPYYRFLEIGWNVQVTSPQVLETIRGKFGMLFSDFRHTSQIQLDHSDLLMIPGGRSSRYMITRHLADIQPVIFHFLESGKPVGALGTGPLMLSHCKHPGVSMIELTSHESVRKEIERVIHRFHDEPVHVWQNIITCQEMTHLPTFIRRVFHVLFERDRSLSQAGGSADQTHAEPPSV